VWNTFETRGRCPGCRKQWRVTVCLACGVGSPHEDWYHDEDDAGAWSAAGERSEDLVEVGARQVDLAGAPAMRSSPSARRPTFRHRTMRSTFAAVPPEAARAGCARACSRG
jgi:hypothetical protein